MTAKQRLSDLRASLAGDPVLKTFERNLQPPEASRDRRKLEIDLPYLEKILDKAKSGCRAERLRKIRRFRDADALMMAESEGPRPPRSEGRASGFDQVERRIGNNAMLAMAARNPPNAEHRLPTSPPPELQELSTEAPRLAFPTGRSFLDPPGRGRAGREGCFDSEVVEEHRELTQHRAELRKALTHQKQLEMELAELKQWNGTLDEQNKALTRRGAEETASASWNLREAEAEAATAKREAAELRSRVEQLLTEKTVAEDQLVSLRVLSERAHAAKRVDAETIYCLQNEIAELSAKEAHTENIRDELVRLRGERNELLTRIAVLEAECDWHFDPPLRPDPQGGIRPDSRIAGRELHSPPVVPPVLFAGPSRLSASQQVVERRPRAQDRASTAGALLGHSMGSPAPPSPPTTARNRWPVGGRRASDSVGCLLREPTAEERGVGISGRPPREEMLQLEKQLTLLNIQKEGVESEILRLPARQPAAGAAREKKRDLEERLHEIEFTRQAVRKQMKGSV